MLPAKFGWGVRMHRTSGVALALVASALGTLAVAAPAPDNNAGTPQVHAAAPPPGLAHTTFDIVVNRFGRRIRGSEGTSVSTPGIGTFIVDFPADVTKCVYVGTLGRATTDGGVDERPGFITVVRYAIDANAVFIQTYGMGNRLRSRPFHLLVAC